MEQQEMTWDNSSSEEVSIEDLDQASKAYLQAREDYDLKKQASNEADSVCKEAMRKLQTMLERAGKDSWETDDGKFSVINKYQFTTPKTLQEKQAFAKWVEENHGKEMFWGIFGVNSQTLNSFMNTELENNPVLKVPGIEDPTHNASIRFNKKRSKK